MWLLVLILVHLLFLVYLKFIFSKRYSWKFPKIQPSYPILGSIPSLWGFSSQSSFKFLCDCFAQTDRISRGMLGPIPILLVNHPDLIKQILLDPNMYDKPFFYDLMELGHGLVTERDGKRWLTDRKALNPTFNTRMLTGFLQIMDVRAKKLVSALAPRASDQVEFDVLQYVLECTLEIAFSTTMGRNAHEMPGQKNYVKNLEIITSKIGERLINVNQYIYFFYRMTDSYKTAIVARKVCNDFVDKIIAQRRAELLVENNNTQKDDEFETKKLNFLDQILTILKDGTTAFTDQEISDSLYTLISAANETSALTISYALVFLAMHPEIQTKAVAEIDAVFYDDSVQISLDTLKQLEYTERVVKEILRMFPAIPLGARQTGSEIVLDGVRIPKGETMVFNWYTFHRRPDIWGPDPDRFDPDRFLPEACQERHPYAYLPFSGGLRNCIGHRYAMNSMRIILLRILQNYEIATSLKQSDIQHGFGISLKLVGSHNVSLKKRSKQSA